MRCSKFEVTALLGVGIFLVGTACLVAVAIHRVFPARKEQNFKEINCTIVSGNMEIKVKCAGNKNGDTSYPCLRIYVSCGKNLNRNGSLEKGHARLLLKDVHSFHKQVCYVILKPRCMFDNRFKKANKKITYKSTALTLLSNT